MVKNPFIESSSAIFQYDINKDRLIRKYKETYKIDITPILSTTDKISVYKCFESGYLFYYPLEISGDSNFYEKFQEYDWYYLPWKWEHEESTRFIKEKNKILEVGCGKGDFLKNVSLRYNNIQCIGLELNKNTISSNENFEILNLSVEDFSLTNETAFDIVCSFQVLEHISMVHSYLKASIRCLKENGLLIVSVPNNQSYMKYDNFNILNMPPHHMGLWTEGSLRKIAELFNLEVMEIAFEPLQPYHFDYYIDLILRRFTGNFPSKIIQKAIGLLKLRNLIKKYLKFRADKIKGHSIMVTYRKLPSCN